MSNPHKGEVSFQANGEEFTLRFSTNALCELEEASGRGIVEITAEMSSWAPPTDGKGKSAPETAAAGKARVGKIRISLVRLMFWAGLRDKHPEIDLKTAGDLMLAVGGMEVAMTLLGRALECAFPPPETKGARPPKRGRALVGTGLNS